MPGAVQGVQDDESCVTRRGRDPLRTAVGAAAGVVVLLLTGAILVGIRAAQARLRIVTYPVNVAIGEAHRITNQHDEVGFLR